MPFNWSSYFNKTLLQKQQENEGFSFLELVVVVVVLSILSAIGLPYFLSFIDQAIFQATKNSLNQSYTTCREKPDQAPQGSPIPGVVFQQSNCASEISATIKSKCTLSMNMSTGVRTGWSDSYTSCVSATTIANSNTTGGDLSLEDFINLTENEPRYKKEREELDANHSLEKLEECKQYVSLLDRMSQGLDKETYQREKEIVEKGRSQLHQRQLNEYMALRNQQTFSQQSKIMEFISNRENDPRYKNELEELDTKHSRETMEFISNYEANKEDEFNQTINQRLIEYDYKKYSSKELREEIQGRHQNFRELSYTHPGYIGLEKTPANSTVFCPGTYKYRDPYYKEIKLNGKYDLENDKNNPLSKNNWLFEYE